MSDLEGASEGGAGWRKARREELIAGRLAIPADRRAAHSQAIAEALDRALGDVAGKAISLYWPFRGEPDLRGWLASVNTRGATTSRPSIRNRMTYQ